jgi:hypothetical protein
MTMANVIWRAWGFMMMISPRCAGKLARRARTVKPYLP